MSIFFFGSAAAPPTTSPEEADQKRFLSNGLEPLKPPSRSAEMCWVTEKKYDRKPENFDEILKVLTRTATGRELLERFMPLYIRKQVVLQNYPVPLVAALRAALPPGQPIGAAFVNDGRIGTIFLDGDSPLGVLAPFLVHELSHALDPKVWNGEVSRKTKARTDSELQAFETQFRFTQELKEKDAAFAEFIRGYLPKARILHQRMSLDDVEELYGDPSAEDSMAS